MLATRSITASFPVNGETNILPDPVIIYGAIIWVTATVTILASHTWGLKHINYTNPITSNSDIWVMEGTNSRVKGEVMIWEPWPIICDTGVKITNTNTDASSTNMKITIFYRPA